MAPDDVVLAPPRTVLKTSSGKIRRAASQAIYQAGKIGVRPRALWWELARLRLRGAAPSLRRARRAAGAVAFAVYTWVVVRGPWVVGCRLAAAATATAMALVDGPGSGPAAGSPYRNADHRAWPRPPPSGDLHRGGQPPQLDRPAGAGLGDASVVSLRRR